MKKILLPILIITTQILFSQTTKKEQNEELIRNSITPLNPPEWGKTPPPSKVDGGRLLVFRDDYSISHEKAIEYSKSFCLSENVGFSLKNSHQTKDGKTLYRYEQTIDGYPVEFTAWHVHEKNNRVTALNGDLVNVQNFTPVFSISEEDALKSALNHIAAELYMWQDENEEILLKEIKKNDNATYYPTGTKVLTPLSPPEGGKNSPSEGGGWREVEELRGAFKFDIFSKQPYNRKMVYIDAQTGDVLFDLPLINFSDEVGIAHTQYCGIRPINTFFDGQKYILHDNTRGNGIKTYNCEMRKTHIGAVNFFDDDNEWNNVNEQLDEYATDAHFASIATYDYFYNIHGRNSIDNKGFELRSYVHYNLEDINGNNVNAFWNGYFMIYGDGEKYLEITPLTTVDICGHEITHGLTAYTANLIYEFEPGALNEAFSDIFGTSIEFYAVPEEANWTLGEKMGKIIRSFENPKKYGQPNTYKGGYWQNGNQVHTNSGVLNYWFYLLCEGGTGVNDNQHEYSVEPIGIEKAEKVAFKLLTEYLTPTSQYYDAYYYSIQVANELFGMCSTETQSVGDAFYAVGVITQPYVHGVKANFEALETEKCYTPVSINFINKSYCGINYLWNFGDGKTSTEVNPVHVYTESGNYTVSLFVDGNACGSATETKENYILIDDTLPCIVIMPVSGHDYFQGCEGIIYDNGGPDSKYENNSNSVLTIHSPNAKSIILEIEEFDIEGGMGCNYDYIAFYDGNSTDAPLINNKKYCNTTGNPGTISSTGEYITIKFVSDVGTALSGYKILFHCENSSINQNQLDNIIISPNPTTGELRIENIPCWRGQGVEELRIENFEIFNVMGKKVQSYETLNSKPETYINISHLPAGMYFIRITTNMGIITKKAVKIK